MFLKKLEIFGFKSFADKVIFNFEKGITAVVGPNGCGKSNVFDAIRWVLGEQSIKELRGSSMEDVIFSGTDKKPGLGFAEVSLTFSNESRILSIEYDEVTVTRRLFRSGESEYLLNKTVVRLKDILELFMGTGIGAEAYSLIQQGKVDLIVSARPEDRRIIIDEAAGITKYKSKKREALNKLKDTDNNLVRINDIVLEVKRQISSLERQATKARRYKDTFGKLKNLEIKLAGFQIKGSEEERSEISGMLETHQEQERVTQSDLRQLNERLLNENETINNLGSKVNDVHSKELRLENQVEINDRQIHFNEERIGELTQLKERLGHQKTQLQQQYQVQREKVEALKSALKNLSETTEQNNQLLQQKKEQLAGISHESREAKEIIRKNEEHILDLTSRQVNLKNEATEVMKEFQGTLARKRRLGVEYEKVMCEKEEVDNQLRSITEDIERCSGKIDDFKGQREMKIEEVGNLKGHLITLNENIDELEKRRLFLKSQKEFIEDLRVQYKDIPDPVAEGTLLTSSPPGDTHTGIIGKVKEVKQLDEYRLNAIKDKFPQWRDRDLYEILCETKFIELDPQQIIAKIEELTNQIEDNSRQRDQVDSEIQQKDGVITSISHSIHDQEKILSSFEAKKNNVLDESSKLLGEMEIVEQELKESRDALSSLKINEDNLNGQVDLVEEEIRVCQREVKEKQSLIAIKAEEREDATVVIAQLETEIESAVEQDKTQQDNLKLFEDAVTNNLEEVNRVEQEVADGNQKSEELKAGIEELKVKIETLKEQKESLKTTLDDYARQKSQVSERIREIRLKITSAEEKIEGMKSEVHGREMKCQELVFNEKSIKDRLMQTYEINWDELIARQEEQVQEVPVTEGQEQVVDQPQSEPEMGINELEPEIEVLKKRCRSYGTVNLVAIEEFDALKERFEFLTKQQSDLLTAKDSLSKTIAKINRTTRQMFLDTFTRVSEEFRIYFRMLFGGGEAQLVLVDQENVLESGIEIIARPPGKKLQNIMLLSGGEKTLAAIALIFGVFKVNPSPFCVLDEIDASLDESNVGRFSYLLKDFAKIAQFIVITHNKRTIVNADVMYGITMQETGVSRIVSVKLADKEDEVREEVPVGV